MTIKYNFTYVNDFISSNNCHLKDDEYFDCKQLLKIQCGCGEIFETTFDKFVNRNKRQCNECSNSKNRIRLEDAIIYCKQYALGYNVLDIKLNKFKKTSIYINCPIEGHPPYWVSWDKFKKGQRCKQCDYNNRINNPKKWSKERIVKFLNNNNLIILDDDYEFNNAKKRIKCLNSEGYMVDVLINSLQAGSIPHIFYRNKYAINNLKLLCKKNNLILDENQQWKGIKKKYNAHTQEGYQVLFNVETILKGSNPRIFHSSNPYSIDNIHLYCKINNPEYQIISTKYKNKKDILLFKYIGNIEMLNEERCFEVSLEAFIFYKQGHPKFKKSKGETIIRNWLIKNKLIYKKEYTFSDCKNISLLRFDFAIFNNKEKTNLKYIIEYDGKQHFEEIEYFGGKDNLLYVQKNDNIKNEFCKKNNIKLLRIPYWEYKNISNILDINLLSA